MKPLRRLTNLLAACAVAAAALIQPALAADLAQDPFITDNTQRQHYEPGGKYHLFGDPRGSVSDRTGQINVIQDYTHRMGNLLIQQANINGTIGYHTRFSGHGYEEHAPFDNHAGHSASKEKGNVDEGFTVYRLNWEGHEHHPADAYDGPKGSDYPDPTGARDEYTYHVNGTARSIKLNPTDTRSIRQRISDNYNNLGSNFSDRADEANKKMFEHNAKLDRWGNSMEFVNGIAAGALNPFISAGEAVDQWMQENPNAAETVEALVNVLPFAKVKNLTKAAKAAKAAKLAKAAKPGKAKVSGDFAVATQAKYKQYGDAHSANAQSALAKKLSGLEGAQNSASRTKTLPDGRIRYYEAERFARTEGRTRGNSFVTEYNPKTGSTRQWTENYDHSGNVTMVHPKSINGQSVTSQHYPPTKQELDSWKK
ncbi:MafB family polymorphic toxin [Neisseria polysaccharea]|uniref:MafB family polymorphic toxin n=1 Tax=Neisseria polysaccharea TaxID=489 RepID=UPI0027E07DC5|nr:MafB family polymorphic toxin [Neisseria polysaccharea]